jgi:hypothetical protein
VVGQAANGDVDAMALVGTPNATTSDACWLTRVRRPESWVLPGRAEGNDEVEGESELKRPTQAAPDEHD